MSCHCASDINVNPLEMSADSVLRVVGVIRWLVKSSCLLARHAPVALAVCWPVQDCITFRFADLNARDDAQVCCVEFLQTK